MEKQSALYKSLSDERNACVVRAFALAANQPYEKVYKLCEKHGRKHGAGTRKHTTEAVVRELGLRLVFDNYYRRAIKSPTLSQFIEQHPRGRFFVIRRGHAFAVIDGVVHDWANSATGPRSRIVYAVEA